MLCYRNRNPSVLGFRTKCIHIGGGSEQAVVQTLYWGTEYVPVNHMDGLVAVLEKEAGRQKSEGRIVEIEGYQDFSMALKSAESPVSVSLSP